jgi:hypothetical protein
VTLRVGFDAWLLRGKVRRSLGPALQEGFGAMKQHGIASQSKVVSRGAVLGMATLAIAGFAMQPSPAVDMRNEVKSPGSLDGRSFRGEIRDEKGVVRAQDVMTFREGLFRSEKCKEMGFEDSRYWMRVEGDVVHFLIESANPAAGKITLSGKVRGAQAEWAGVWLKERWYWTVRRDISFKGAEVR